MAKRQWAKDVLSDEEWKQHVARTFMGFAVINGEDKCWIWKGAVAKKLKPAYKPRCVYTAYFRGEKPVCESAQRVSYRLFKENNIGKDTRVENTCHNAFCVKPEHLCLRSIKRAA